MTPALNNRQARKTRTALLSAFRDLVVERRYADIRVGDIIRRADVGRSTFYEHFRDKDDLLRESASVVLAPLADAVREDCDTARVRHTLEHFRENERLARSMFNGPSWSLMASVLACQIEGRFVDLRKQTGRTPALPLDLAAGQAAGALLGLVRGWILHGASCPADTVAAAMHQCAVASTRALFSA